MAAAWQLGQETRDGLSMEAFRGINWPKIGSQGIDGLMWWFSYEAS